MRTIPVYQPDLSGNERNYVLECIDTTWISSKGSFIARFESGFSKLTGASFAATVCNGTVALHLALLAAGVQVGDEVIVPSLTYIASVNAIHYVGATPVFADSLPDSWQVDPAHIEDLITERTSAIIAVHLYGGACDMAKLSQLCSTHGLKLIEDCAEAIGTQIAGRHVGTFGDIATFSFFGNKTLTTGEGGMVVCNDPDTDAKVRHLRGQGLAHNRQYWHDVIGYNYRMTNICAAIGTAQLERAEYILGEKRRLAERYRTLLKDTPVSLQASRPEEQHSYWMITILTPNPTTRDPLRTALAAAGVETRPVFYPAHVMPMYSNEQQDLPVAENIAARGINLPSWHQLSDDDLAYICAIVRSFEWGE